MTYGKLMTLLAIGLAALLLWRQLLILAADILVFLDKLFSFGMDSSPMVGWMMACLFTGTVYGAWVCIKKYRVENRILIVSVSCAVLFLLILFIGNHPIY